MKTLGVVTIILKSGLELVAEVEQELNQFQLKKPFKIETAYVPQQTPQGIAIAGMPQMIPFPATAITSNLTIMRDDILEIKQTNKAVSDAYFKRTTGFELASA